MASLEYSKTMAVGEAECLWDLFGFSSPKDLVPEDLALARNVIVTEGPLEKMEARLVRQGKYGLMRIRDDIAEVGRKRFAIAHELGHWELHQQVSQLFACTSDDMVAAYKASTVEAEANYFASGLLMPTRLFSQQCARKAFSVANISELSCYFYTSFTATAIRYADLSSEACAIVASSAGKIRWWRGSPDFESQFWITTRSQLSQNTVAGSIFHGGSRPTGPIEVDIAEWSDREVDEDSDTFIEECVVMERYGCIMSLLRLP